ncbi:hypothetical protein BMS3Abin05_00119 [bacterium BMS3Abin05]|nr:hypothetical protein BMS3Abin05_00119 [bacterium BMS3Abin05]
MKKHRSLWHRISVIVFPVFLLGEFLYFSGCSFKAPQAPQWDVNMAIPLMDTTLTLGNLLKDTQDVTFDSSGLLGFEIEESMDPVEVGDNLSVENIAEKYDVTLGDIKIDSPGSQSISVQFVSIYPPSASLNGQSTQVPAFSIALDKTEIPPFADFESVLIKQGTLTITLQNHLPVPIASGLGINLYDFNTDTLVMAILSEQEIPVNGSIRLERSFANKRLPGHLSFQISGGSPGSGSQSVTINTSTQGIDLAVSVSDMIASEARAKVPDQEFEDTDYADLGDSIIVTEADISTGSISFTMQNNLPLDLDLTIKLLDFFNASGDTFQAHLYLGKRKQVFKYYDLSGFKFRPERTAGGSAARFEWKAKAFGSGDSLVTIHASDGISLAVDMPKLAFSKLSGILNRIHVQMDSMSTSLDIPDGLEGLQFGDARIALELTNGIGFLIQPTLNIVGENTKTGQTASIHRTVTINPAGAQPSVTTVILKGSEVTNFLNVLPDKINVSGSVILGDGTTESTVRSTDKIASKVTINLPANLKFPDQAIKLDPDTLEIDQDAQDEIRDNANSGAFHAELGNHLPFGGSVSFYFSSLDTAVFSHPELTIGPITLNPGITSDEGGVIQETSSTIDIQLDKEQLSVFAHPKVYMAMKIAVPGSGEKFVRVYRNDYLTAKAYIKANYHVNPEGKK